ncbi:hypothetical protein Bhyg_09880 [Pseudolycoriella hygida]|uniref:CD80-like immunoglobulin C2-set domain-containing protein n=1 Tax=Pseudolycoriella hygida TaxID=35572 RepID=A0A9Q0RYN6_9DIPT|nr:hypothetical protein Bhyg_09880 [Pseudolycoriella hygida]
MGEKLLANCTTSKARPAPKITWLINGQKVEDKHTKSLHSVLNGKSSHRSKSLQQGNPSYDKMESSGMLAKTPDFAREKSVESNGNHLRFEIHPNSGYDNSAFDTGNIMETFSDYFDDKYFGSRKHRNLYNHKNRRHVNDLNNRNIHKAVASGSQLSIDVSDLTKAHTGRLEITCLATIPAHVGPGEQFADYKTSSVKVDIDSTENTSMMPAMSGMAALGNSSNGTKLPTITTTIPICLPISVVLLKLINKYGVRIF